MILHRLDEILQQKKLSLYQLSKAANVNYVTLRKFYHGEATHLNLELLGKICKTLNCTISDIIYLSNDTSDRN